MLTTFVKLYFSGHWSIKFDSYLQQTRFWIISQFCVVSRWIILSSCTVVLHFKKICAQICHAIKMILKSFVAVFCGLYHFIWHYWLSGMCVKVFKKMFSFVFSQCYIQVWKHCVLKSKYSTLVWSIVVYFYGLLAFGIMFVTIQDHFFHTLT